MDDIRVRASTLNDLRDELVSIEARQLAAVGSVITHLSWTREDLDAAFRRARAELETAEAAYLACLRAATQAAVERVPGPDCSGYSRDVDFASERTHRIGDAIAELRRAGDQFEQAARRHQAYLEHGIASMRNALHARSVGVDAYLGFRSTTPSIASTSPTAARAMADDPGTGRGYGADQIPHPVEGREGRGTERGG